MYSTRSCLEAKVLLETSSSSSASPLFPQPSSPSPALLLHGHVVSLPPRFAIAAAATIHRCAALCRLPSGQHLPTDLPTYLPTRYYYYFTSYIPAANHLIVTLTAFRSQYLLHCFHSVSQSFEAAEIQHAHLCSGYKGLQSRRKTWPCPSYRGPEAGHLQGFASRPKRWTGRHEQQRRTRSAQIPAWS